jgi:hypothetical protein
MGGVGGAGSDAATGDEPADFLHPYLMNRGLTTQTVMDDVARHHEVFDAALGELSAGARPTG